MKELPHFETAPRCDRQIMAALMGASALVLALSVALQLIR